MGTEEWVPRGIWELMFSSSLHLHTCLSCFHHCLKLYSAGLLWQYLRTDRVCFLNRWSSSHRVYQCFCKPMFEKREIHRNVVPTVQRILKGKCVFCFCCSWGNKSQPLPTPDHVQYEITLILTHSTNLIWSLPFFSRTACNRAAGRAHEAAQRLSELYIPFRTVLGLQPLWSDRLVWFLFDQHNFHQLENIHTSLRPFFRNILGLVYYVCFQSVNNCHDTLSRWLAYQTIASLFRRISTFSEYLKAFFRTHNCVHGPR